ncbi:MAG TPA: aminomethyl-transferring glycine dehydrogenase subunit GcvPB [bacterium]|nr:aminomethyl-transferring glycine dehydrogenase subunit GcvPB [bacterium]
MQLIFEKSQPGRTGFKIQNKDVPAKAKLPENLMRKSDIGLPEVSELDVIRHFSGLANMNFCVDTNFYPLGSCTMKYNPKFTEKAAGFEGFSEVHPLLPQLMGGGVLTQGCLEILYNMEKLLNEITGMDAFTMQPLAGAHGELTGAMIIAAYHKNRKNRKRYILVPDSSHGTNPASAAIAGFDVIVIPSDRDGVMDINQYRKHLNEDVAGVMLTCPNTLGIFNPRIKEICEMGHKVDALLYYDGANLNAILGKLRPGDVGFDIVHLNLHKTFATPHGGGGPGAGPVGVKEHLAEFMPISKVVRRADGTFCLDYNYPKSIGYIAPFYGNFGVIVKAYAYILMLGKSGLIDVAEKAVLNANYARAKLTDCYKLPYDRKCMHECVFSAEKQKQNGVSALDIAKYLISRGFHPPTVYFPLIVKEALMIEPTETESKETIDSFIEAMKDAAELAEKNPGIFASMPDNTPVQKPDEVKAARDLDIKWSN